MADEIKILFLGTGAADWPYMKDSKRKGIDTSFRRWSSILVDNRLLIDPGPCFFDSCRAFDVTAWDVDGVLITHSHDDHYCADTLKRLCRERAENGKDKLHVWGPKGMQTVVPQCDGLVFHGILPQDTFEVLGYSVEALEANHEVEQTGETCLHYVVTKEEKTFFYGCDGAWILQRTWNQLLKYRFDGLILDATAGVTAYAGVCGHNNLAMVKILHIAFLAAGLLKPDAKVVASHLGLTLYPAHEEIAAMMEKNGLISAYDGMALPI